MLKIDEKGSKYLTGVVCILCKDMAGEIYVEACGDYYFRCGNEACYEGDGYCEDVIPL